MYNNKHLKRKKTEKYVMNRYVRLIFNIFVKIVSINTAMREKKYSNQ